VAYTSVAFAMSMLGRASGIKAAVPVTLLLALVPVALIVGRMASLLVTIVVSLVFAEWLFEPYGSLVIRSAADRIELLSFGLAAIAVVYYSPSSGGVWQKRHHGYVSGRAPLSSSFESRSTIKTSDPIETWVAIVGYAVVFMALVTLLLSMWN